MKKGIFLLIILSSVIISFAQKTDSLRVIKPNIKKTAVTTANPKLINQKLVKLQGTIKKLETTLNEAKGLMDELKKQKDSMSELNEQDMLELQQLMEKKSQLEQMISNIMKASSETQANIIKNMKAS